MICEDFQCILEHNFSPFGRKAVVGGMSAGAIGQFFASPTDLVKVQMQMEGKRKLEGKPLRSVPLRAGVFFPVTDHSVAQGVVLFFSATPSPQLLCALLQGEHPMALGSEGGGIQDLLLIPFILIFSILIYWSQGPQIHAPCCSTSMPALYHGGE